MADNGLHLGSGATQEEALRDAVSRLQASTMSDALRYLNELERSVPMILVGSAPPAGCVGPAGYLGTR